jgi:hypothetical protein
MATPADQRLLELFDKWLKSLELHASYSALDDDDYWKIQSWAPHQRPTRWIVEVALEKTRALRTELVKRMEAGDASFSDSMELTMFLANLLGAEHIERFIPLAEARPARKERPPPRERTAPRAPPRKSTRAAQSMTTDQSREQVVADAARLVHWGRRWYELPELIARMAGRPPLAEVRRILKENKSAIDEKAGSA